MEDTAQEQETLGARRFLQMVSDGEKAFADYNKRCDNIEKKYASLKTLAEVVGDREFQLFWANMEVLRPTIYQRPPKPVVQQRYRNRNEVAREAAEMLQRGLEYDIEDDDLHDTLTEVRDDLAMGGRGVTWVLDDGRCIHVDRHDFIHEPARKWREVGWVARRAYMDRASFEKRFPEADRTKVKFDHQDPKDDGEGEDYKTTEKKAAVWEMWHKGRQMVLWVTEDYEDALDARPPLVNVKGFFPCPRPAYGTLEPRTLLPVPDYVYYRDQLDEINELTARISSLSESLRLKGFYASGATEVGEAVETAMKATDNKAILVPVSNFGALGGQKLADSIIWLPLDQVVATITALVQLRKQLIEDVYEITGISDIMRGETEASETATAQSLKAQYGSVRVRERQNEMARIARDILRIKAEIRAESFDIRFLASQAQMQIPDEMQAQQYAAQATAQGQQLKPMVTLEKIDALLKNERLRPFVLEVETDSTIAPNEKEEKESRIEFVTAMGGFIQQAGAMVTQQPETASFAIEMMKFAAGAFRAGRELSSAMDEFADTVQRSAQQAMQQRSQPSPEQQAMQQKAQAEMAKLQADMQRTQAEVMKIQAEGEITTQQAAASLQKTMAEIEKIEAETARIQSQPREAA